MKKAGKVVVFLRAKDIKISRIACLTGRRFLGKEKNTTQEVKLGCSERYSFQGLGVKLPPICYVKKQILEFLGCAMFSHPYDLCFPLCIQNKQLQNIKEDCEQ